MSNSQDAVADTTAKSVARPTAIMAAGTTVSRVLGFVRTMALVAVFGGVTTSLSGPAFDLANTLPNMLFAIIGGGVLNVILVPQIVRAFAQKVGEEYVNTLVSVGTVLLAIVTAGATLLSPVLIDLFASGSWSGQQRSLAVAFSYWCIPQLFFYGMYTLFGEILNARKNFGPYMWSPVLNNIISIAGFVAILMIFGQQGNSTNPADLVHWTPIRIAALGGTATLGVAVQALALLIPIRRAGFRLEFRWRVRGMGFGKVGSVALWTMGAITLDIVAANVATRISSGAPHAVQALGGSAIGVAGNQAAQNAVLISVLPHSIITISLATALFTSLSQAAAAGANQQVRTIFSNGIRTIGVFSVLATTVMVVLALPVTRIVLMTGAPVDIPAVANIVVAGSLALVPLGITLMMKRVYYAFEKVRALFVVEIFVVAIYIGGMFLLQHTLPPQWWAVGNALASSVSTVASVVFLGLGMRPLVRQDMDPSLISFHARAFLAAIVSGLFGWWVLSFVPGRGGTDVLWAIVACVVVGLAIAICYALCLRALKIDELSSFVSALTARLRRRR